MCDGASPSDVTAGRAGGRARDLETRGGPETMSVDTQPWDLHAISMRSRCISEGEWRAVGYGAYGGWRGRERWCELSTCVPPCRAAARHCLAVAALGGGELCGVRDGVSVCVSLPWAGRQVPLCIWDLVGLLRSVSRAATMEMRIAKI